MPHAARRSIQRMYLLVQEPRDTIIVSLQ